MKFLLYEFKLENNATIRSLNKSVSIAQLTKEKYSGDLQNSVIFLREMICKPNSSVDNDALKGLLLENDPY